MFLSERKYLEIRGKLKDIIRDSRDRINPGEELQKRLAEDTEKTGIKQEFLKRYINGIDYGRAIEFYNAIRKIRQDNFQIYGVGCFYRSDESKNTITLAEHFANSTIELRKKRPAA